MAFTAKTWADGSGGNTPITAAELNRIELNTAVADRGRKTPDGRTEWFKKADSSAISNRWCSGRRRRGPR